MEVKVVRMDEREKVSSGVNSDLDPILEAFDENLWKIEITLREYIKNSQKSLLGEFGLDEKQNFNGSFFSLTELSDFLISSKTVRSNLASAKFLSS